MVLLNVCELRQNRSRESRTFPNTINEINIYACTMKPLDISKVKNASAKPVATEGIRHL